MWVLNDFEGNPIRYYDFPAEGAVKVEEVVEPKLTYDELFDAVGECLI